MTRDQRFTIKEVAEATGLNAKTLNSRAKRFRQEGIFPKIRSVAFYTYDQVKQLIRKPKQERCDVRPAMVDALKRQLQTDGYKINKNKPNEEATA